MTGPLPVARILRRAGDWSGPSARIALDYEARFLRRKRLETLDAGPILVDLPETVSLNHGDALELDDGRLVEIAAAPEPLIAVRGAALVRLAWHIGNRHTPCQIEPDRLLIREDHVLADMLRGLGAALEPVTEPFTPEGGAYGHGRTLPHSHGPHDHGAHDNGAHDHGGHDPHSHSHSHSHGPRDHGHEH